MIATHVSKGTISDGQNDGNATYKENGFITSVAETDCNVSCAIALVIGKGHAAVTDMKDPEIVLSITCPSNGNC